MFGVYSYNMSKKTCCHNINVFKNTQQKSISNHLQRFSMQMLQIIIKGPFFSADQCGAAHTETPFSHKCRSSSVNRRLLTKHCCCGEYAPSEQRTCSAPRAEGVSQPLRLLTPVCSLHLPFETCHQTNLCVLYSEVVRSHAAMYSYEI